MEVLLTAVEAAKRLRISPNTVRALLKNGRIPAVKIGRAWRVREVVLDEIARGEVNLDERKRPELKVIG